MKALSADERPGRQKRGGVVGGDLAGSPRKRCPDARIQGRIGRLGARGAQHGPNEDLRGLVGASNEGPRGDKCKSHRAALPFELLETRGLHVPIDGGVFRRRPKVLTNRDDIDSG